MVLGNPGASHPLYETLIFTFFFLTQKRDDFQYANGASYCISESLMAKAEKYLRYYHDCVDHFLERSQAAVVMPEAFYLSQNPHS